jgi:hypothetical protein
MSQFATTLEKIIAILLLQRHRSVVYLINNNNIKSI